MTEDSFVHKVASKTLIDDGSTYHPLELQWYIVEQASGGILNQMFVGPSDDGDMEWEPEFDISLDVGSLKDARRLWKGLVKLVDLLKGEEKK